MRPLTREPSVEELHAQAEARSEMREAVDERRTALIEKLHAAEVEARHYMEIASEASDAGLRVRPSDTLREASTPLIERLVEIESGEWSA